MSKLNKATKKLIDENPKILNVNLAEWIKEYKLNEATKVDWKKLMALFNKITGKKVRVVPVKARKQIRQRLREGFTKVDIRNALINAMQHPYHQETNFQYITLEFISRSEKLSRFSTQNTAKVKKKADTFK